MLGGAFHTDDYTDRVTALSEIVANLTTAQLAQLATAIKQFGQELGFAKIGVAETALAADEAHLEQWLAAGRHGTMDYMQRHGRKRTRPAAWYPAPYA
jgi:epoxyqueuosine reductase